MARLIRFIKRSWFVLLTVVVLLGIIVWAIMGLAVPSETEEEISVFVIAENLSDDSWSSFKSGLDQAAGENNVILSYAPSASYNTISAEKMVLEQEISNGIDGVIISVCADHGAEDLLNSIPYNIPVVLVQTEATREISDKHHIASAVYDSEAIGASLIGLVCDEYGDDLSNKTIGILGGNQRQLGMQSLMNSVTSAIEAKRGTVSWTDEMEDKAAPDILLALDSKSLMNAATYINSNPDYETALFGAGSGATNVYYLDKGLIHGMVVSNEFNMGYQSLSNLVQSMENSGYEMTDYVIDFRAVKRSEMYEQENERILFPMN